MPGERTATPETEPQAAENRGFLIALAYLGPFALVPLVIAGGDGEARWHARQGLALFAVWLAICLAVELVVRAAAFGYLAMFVYPVVGLAAAAIHGFCLLQGLRGRRVSVPAIHRLADRF